MRIQNGSVGCRQPTEAFPRSLQSCGILINILEIEYQDPTLHRKMRLKVQEENFDMNKRKRKNPASRPNVSRCHVASTQIFPARCMKSLAVLNAIKDKTNFEMEICIQTCGN